MRRLSIARAAVAAGLCMALGTSRVPAAALPALNIHPTAESRPGKIEWADLFTGDVAAAERFYTGIFGWTSSRAQTNSGYRSKTTGERHEYILLSCDGQPVAGLVQRGASAAQRPARWIVYAAVVDLEKTCHAAAQAGGTVLVTARDVPRRGRQAVISDPEGAILGLIQSASGDLPDRAAPVNGWTWFELFSRSPRTTSNFYRRIADYDIRPDTREGRPDHYLMLGSGRARAGIQPLPSDSPGAAPDWIGFVRVPRLDVTLAQVTAAGGEVIEPPQQAELASRFALVSDPCGGVFGLVEFAPASP